MNTPPVTSPINDDFAPDGNAGLGDAVANLDRLASLRETALLDSAPEADFDRLTRLAARIFHAPVSLVSLVDENRQFFKASCGLPEAVAAKRESPLSHSFCQFVVAQDAPLVVNDARTNPRLQDNGAVRDWNVRAYLGVPIRSTDGRHVWGAFCVIDTVPREWTEDDVSLLTDLSQSVMAEIELRSQMRLGQATEARLRRAVRGSRDGLWEWNVQTDVLFLSPQSKAMLGYDDDEIPNTCDGWRGLLYKDDAEAINVALETFAKLPRPEDLCSSLYPVAQDGDLSATHYELEYRMNHRDGTIRWIYSRGIGERDAEGNLLLLSGSHTDITDRKRSEIAMEAQTKALKTQAGTLKTQAIELEKTRDYAISSARAKSQFLANMSHEIRTPMNGVIGMVSLILETSLTTEQREYLRTIRSSSESLMAIINDILDLSKIESGNLELDESPFVLRTVVEEAAEMMMPKVREKNIELTCSVSPSLPAVFRGDAGRLRQILLNIGMNAAKFTDTGLIEISAAIAPVPNERDDMVMIRFVVADTGIGIAPDRQSAVFDSFTQADVSTTRKYGGTGLGLAISRQLSQLMGGDISLVSHVGIGSTFTVQVPLFVETDEDTAALAIAAQAISSLGREDNGVRVETLLARKRVLVIDDVAANRRILREQLQAWGAWVEEAENGMDGVRALGTAFESTNNTPFSLVVLDMHMPGIDGRTTAQLIKGDTRFADTPIVLLSSGGAVREYGRRIVGSTDLFTAVIGKPVRQADLLTAVLRSVSNVPAPAIASPVVTAAPTGTPPPFFAAFAPHSSIDSAAYRIGGDASDARLLEGVRVLLAEDNLVNQKVALALLGKWGCPKPVAVENGVQAVEAVMERAGTPEAFDLVLMDVQMPEMDGLTATERIRDAEEERGVSPVPIVALTAHAMTGDRERCLASGMSDYVAKPVRPDALKTVLQKWLGLTQSPSFTENGKGFTLRTPELPTLNETVLRESCDDDNEVIAEVLAAFAESVPILLGEIEDTIEARETKAARTATHTLKGSSRTVGADAFAYLCEQIELAVREGDFSHAAVELGKARDEWQRLTPALEAVVARM